MLKKNRIPAFLSLIFLQGILSINHAQDSLNKKIDSLLTNKEYRIFKDLVLRKTKELSNYIITITDKNTDNDIKMTSIDQAVKLFINEEKTVEVSSINHERIGNFKIREYLNRIKSLDYRQIIITWYEYEIDTNNKMLTRIGDKVVERWYILLGNIKVEEIIEL